MKLTHSEVAFLMYSNDNLTMDDNNSNDDMTPPMLLVMENI